jgi:hypothetical protein
MMFLPLALLLIGVGAVSVVVEERLQARKQRVAPAPADEAGEATAAEAASSMADRLWSEVKGWSDRIMHRTPADFPPRFRAWAVQAAADDRAVKDWFNALSEEGLQAFTEHLVAFCSEMGFELSWLVEQQFDKHPELAQATERIVLHYCRACLQAALTQEDLGVYKQLLAFEQDPFSRKNQAFGERLFDKVVEEGLVAAKMSEYFLAPPKERQQLAVAAIRQAAAKDSAAFNRAVKEIMRGRETAAAAF